MVIDGKIGEPQLRPQSIELIKLLSDPPRTIDYASVYPLRPVTALDGPQGQGEHQFGGADGLALWRLTVEGLHPDGSGEGPHLLEQGTPAPAGFLHRLTTPHPVIQFGLYWQVPATFAGPDYRIGLRLLDAAGQVVAQTDTRPDEDRAATHTWRPGGLYPDLHNIQAPPGPGTYTVQLAVYPDGQPAAADTWIAPLRIETP